MIHRRKFLKNSALIAAGSLLAGRQLLASGLPVESRQLTVVLCGGLWHRSGELPSGWKNEERNGEPYLIPDFLTKGQLEAGLNFGEASAPLINKVEDVLKYARLARPASVQTADVQNGVWDGKKLYGIQQIPCGIPRDAQFLYRTMNSEPEDDIWLLHATDLGHGSVNAYLAAEAQSLAVIQHAYRVAKKSAANFQLVCLHGRNPDSDYTALHHSGTSESRAGYRLQLR